MIMAIAQIIFMLMIVAGLVIFVFAPNTGILIHWCAVLCLFGFLGIVVASFIKFQIDYRKARKAQEEAEAAEDDEENADTDNK